MNLDAPGVQCSPSQRPPPHRIWRAQVGAFAWVKLLLLLLLWFLAVALLACELLRETDWLLARRHRLKDNNLVNQNPGILMLGYDWYN